VADPVSIDERVGDAAVIVIDLAGVVTHWSAGAEALYGYAQTEAVDRSLCELIFAPDDQGICEQIRDGLDETGTWEGEFWLRRRDGTKFLARVYETTVEDDLGRWVGFIGVSYEVPT
jgi:PAS domain S-box-containing protein